MKVIDPGIRITRWRREKVRGDRRTDFPIAGFNDPTSVHWVEYDYCVPGVMRVEGRAYGPGVLENNKAFEEDKFAPPPEDAVPRGVNIASHIVTPMTESTTRHFFAWGFRPQDGDEDGADRLLKLAQVAFAEDRTMIEAQHRNMQGKVRREGFTNADAGPMHMRSIIQKLMDAERPGTP